MEKNLATVKDMADAKKMDPASPLLNLFAIKETERNEIMAIPAFIN